MTPECWQNQKARLIDRFGEKNFSREFSLLVALECKTMPDEPFVQMVNAMIGNRTPNNPPLLQSFRDGRLAYERRMFDRDVRGAAQAWHGEARFQGLRAYLSKAFPGCKSLAEAVEVRKLQIQVRQADEPGYQPMADAEWMA